ncbi:MAG: tetratricopeptide repeat protein [Rhizomicrobium sp.]
MRVVPILFALFVPLAAQAATAPAHTVSKPPLETKFGQLAQAGSPEDAKPIEDRIGAIFLQSGSASVDLLMSRLAAAQAAGDKDAAKKLAQAVTDVAPDFAEGWHSRANFQRATGDDAGAMVSLERVILLNPRQFAALYELGTMMEDYGNKAAALKLYRKALELDPQLDGARRHVDALTRDVEGQGI